MVAPTSEADSSAHAVRATLVDVEDVVELAPVVRVVVLDPDDPGEALEQEASARPTTRVKTRASRSAHGR
jgi:hypothetical protein